MSKEHLIHDYIAGALGGAAGLVVGHPFDTTKVQLQTQHHGNQYKGAVDAIKHIHKTGWERGFYRGLSWPLLSFAAVDAIYFGTYGNIMRLFEEDRTERKTAHGKIFMAGCLASLTQLTVQAPVELIKTTLQSQIPRNVQDAKMKGMYSKHGTHGNMKSLTYYQGPGDCFLSIYRKHGVFGVYKGSAALLFRDVPSNGLYILMYEIMNKFLTDRSLTDERGIIASWIAGGCAGSTAWICTLPCDVIKNRYQADCAGRYSGLVDCAIKSFQEHGYKIFFRGGIIVFLRAFPVNGLSFVVYSQTLRNFEQRNQVNE